MQLEMAKGIAGYLESVTENGGRSQRKKSVEEVSGRSQESNVIKPCQNKGDRAHSLQ